MANTLNMDGLYEEDVLVALHKHAKQDPRFPDELDPTPLTYREAQELLGSDRYIQRVRGKTLMAYFSRKETLDLTTYASYNGEEAVKSVVQELTPAA